MNDDDAKSLVAGSNLAILEIMRLLYAKGVFGDDDWNYIISSMADISGGGDLKQSQQASIDRLTVLLGRFHPNKQMRINSK